jgi:hypothetical protein
MPAKRHRNQLTNGGAPPSVKVLKTMAAVISALGGPGKVAKLTGRKSTHLHNWQNDTGRFPAKTHPVMQAALTAKGYSAPDELWGVIKP